MDISPILHVSAQGIHRSIERLNAAAGEIAKPDNSGAVEPQVEMIIAEHGLLANVNAFRSAAYISHTILDIMA